MTFGLAKSDDDRRETMLRHLDGALADEEVRKLNTRLRVDPTARREFADLLLQQVQLGIIGQEQKTAGVSPVTASKDTTGIVHFFPPWLSGLFSGTPSTLYRLFARRRNSLAWASCGVLCLSTILYLFLPIGSTPMLANPVAGSVGIQRGGSPFLVKGPVSLQPGDVIQSALPNGITIQYGDEPTRLHLDSSAVVQILPWNRGKRVELRQGTLEGAVAHQLPFKPMVITTPQAEARIQGTRFTLTTTTEGTRLGVTEGKVRFTRLSDHKSVQVGAGNYAVASATYELLAQPLTGSILREYWTNLPGEYFTMILTSAPAFPEHPSGRDYLDKFEGPSDWGRNYGARIRGYLHPPRTGAYTFWIATGDGGELYLSPDENPERKQLIANSADSAPHEWTKLRKQQSSAINLVAGRKYYIEALQKQGDKDDHLAVAWKGPGREIEVIPGKFLSPPSLKSKERSP